MWYGPHALRKSDGEVKFEVKGPHKRRFVSVALSAFISASLIKSPLVRGFYVVDDP